MIYNQTHKVSNNHRDGKDDAEVQHHDGWLKFDQHPRRLLDALSKSIHFF